MWQAPNHRVRALAAQKRRDRERKRTRLHLKRVVAEIRIPAGNLGGQAQNLAARVVLNDLSVKGVSVFSPVMLNAEQEVQITLDHPRKFFVRGRVAWSQEVVTETHVISQNPFRYRIGVEFSFTSPEEEEEVRKFVQELVQEHLVTRQEAA